MKRAAFAVNNFGKMTNGRLAAFGLNVGARLVGNTNYPAPPVSPAAIIALGNAFQAKLSAAIGGGIQARAEARQARADLVAALTATTRYINSMTFNDAAAIEGAGFHVSVMERRPAALPEKPELTVTQGENRGTAIIKIKGGKGVRVYTAIVYNAAPEAALSMNIEGVSLRNVGDVQVLTAPAGKIKVLGLTSAQRYNVVAFVTNTAGRSLLSDIRDVMPG